MDIGPLLPGRMPNSLVTQRLQAEMQAGRFGMSQLETEIDIQPESIGRSPAYLQVQLKTRIE